ncbi:MAG: hypothetical protein J6M95_02080 [Bacilli bacterium]|nr:hypothetical protein [Bacilli bacterium]
MKKSPLLFLTMLLPLTGVSFSFSGKAAHAIGEIEKTIYVDLSLNSKYLEEGSNPYISIDDVHIELISVEHDIYQSKTKLSNEDINNGFKICCFNGTYQSGLINSDSIKEDYNYVCLSSYEEGNIDIEGYGIYNDILTNPGATYKTQRIWLYDEENNVDAWGNNTSNAITYLDNEVVKTIAMEEKINQDGKIYHYADIPSYITSIRFNKISSEINHNYIFYKDILVPSLIYGTCYSISENTYSSGIVKGADVYLLSEVVQAYLTFGESPSNGCVKQTVQNLYQTWFANKTASDNELKNEKIWDYTGYANNGNSYEGLEKNAQFSVNEKWNTMCSQVGIDPKTGQDRGIDFLTWFKENRLLVLGAAILILFVTFFTAFFFIKKKKRS